MNRLRLGWLITLGLIGLAILLLLFYAKDLVRLVPASLSPKMEVSPFEGWRPYTPPSGKYTALFPAIAQHLEEEVVNSQTKEKLHYDMAIAEKWDSSLFLVTVISFPQRGNPTDRLKEFVADTLASGPSNQLTSAKEGSFKGYPSIIFQIKNGKKMIDGVAFMEKKDLFFLSYIPGEDAYQGDWKYFIDNFSLGKNLPATGNFPNDQSKGNDR